MCNRPASAFHTGPGPRERAPRLSELPISEQERGIKAELRIESLVCNPATGRGGSGFRPSGTRSLASAIRRLGRGGAMLRKVVSATRRSGETLCPWHLGLGVAAAACLVPETNKGSASEYLFCPSKQAPSRLRLLNVHQVFASFFRGSQSASRAGTSASANCPQ